MDVEMEAPAALEPVEAMENLKIKEISKDELLNHLLLQCPPNEHEFILHGTKGI